MACSTRLVLAPAEQLVTGTSSGGSLTNCSSPSTTVVSLALALSRSFDSALVDAALQVLDGLAAELAAPLAA